MKANDVTEPLELALEASGRDRAEAAHKPRQLSDNGSSNISGNLAHWPEDQGWTMFVVRHTIRRRRASSRAGIKRSKTEFYWKLLSARRPRKPNQSLCEPFQQQPMPPEP